MIIATITLDQSAIVMLFQDLLEAAFPDHEWRGIIVAQEYAGSNPDDTWLKALEEPADHKPGDLPAPPDICLIFLPDVYELPDWTEPLASRLKKRIPNASLIWITAVDQNTMKLFGYLNKPEENSFLLNIEYPRGFPKLPTSATEEDYIEAERAFQSDNYWSTFSTWLRKYIG